MAQVEISPGEPWPLGAHACCDGTNFAIFSRHAQQLELWIFDTVKARTPSRRVLLDPACYRTGDIWHVRIGEDLRGRCYALRAHAPALTDVDDRFVPEQLLLDPFAAAVLPRSAPVPDPAGGANAAPLRCAYVGIITDPRFDWQGVSSPKRPWSETIIYETHVRGLTAHPSANAEHPGQYLGLIEKIPHLRELGVTAVELLPVQGFDPHAFGGRTDYWGYNPIALFAPHAGYASSARVDSALTEFKTLVRELHRAGIEVILDVVFNHTGEGGAGGPTYSFRGLDNAIYYLLSTDGRYLDYTGCGNTLNCNHPIVRTMILECLRHWVVHLHIDGFRFDLAAVLGRGPDGALLANPPVLEEISEDPILRNVKLIAEAWDTGGAFQVGHFPGARFGEWNCHFRDDVRRFWRGDPGMSGALASRLCGSADLYQRGNQTPLKSINFVTSHDGFTLADLVSYATKHNTDNGEHDRDGMNENSSANYGAEGTTANPVVNALRRRQCKNFLATLLLARGVPMLLGGDEFGRTQRGNNNAYCQDNEISWYDWRLVHTNADLVRFVRHLIRFRQSHAILHADRFYTAEEIRWLPPVGGSLAWHGPHNRVGCIVHGDGHTLCLLLNATTEACAYTLEGISGQWRVRIDTSREAPDDAPETSDAPVYDSTVVHVGARAVLVLEAL